MQHRDRFIHKNARRT